MAKFMRTIRDAREELSNEIRSTSPLLTDSYTTGNIHDIEERLDNKISDLEELEEELEVPEDKKESKVQNEKQKTSGSCGCR